jgi:hypothetical protein
MYKRFRRTRTNSFHECLQTVSTNAYKWFRRMRTNGFDECVQTVSTNAYKRFRLMRRSSCAVPPKTMMTTKPSFCWDWEPAGISGSVGALAREHSGANLFHPSSPASAATLTGSSISNVGAMSGSDEAGRSEVEVERSRGASAKAEASTSSLRRLSGSAPAERHAAATQLTKAQTERTPRQAPRPPTPHPELRQAPRRAHHEPPPTQSETRSTSRHRERRPVNQPLLAMQRMQQCKRKRNAKSWPSQTMARAGASESVLMSFSDHASAQTLRRYLDWGVHSVAQHRAAAQAAAILTTTNMEVEDDEDETLSISTALPAVGTTSASH